MFYDYGALQAGQVFGIVRMNLLFDIVSRLILTRERQNTEKSFENGRISVDVETL